VRQTQRLGKKQFAERETSDFRQQFLSQALRKEASIFIPRALRSSVVLTFIVFKSTEHFSHFLDADSQGNLILEQPVAVASLLISASGKS
jgi:hypothetical protein